MSNNPETPRGSATSSIAALRQILMLDTPTRDILNDKHNALQEARYQEQQRYAAEMKGQLDQIKELKKRVKDLQKECETERSMRKTLETTYEALSNHKKELTVQLELVSKARQRLEEKLDASLSGANNVDGDAMEVEGGGSSTEELKTIRQQRDQAVKKSEDLERQLSTSRREVEDLKRKNILLTAQGSGDKNKQDETLQAFAATNERLKKQTEENEDKLQKAQIEVRHDMICICLSCSD